MNRAHVSVGVSALGLVLAIASAGCSSLTQPQEITIAAEPVPSPNAPPPSPNAGAPAPGMAPAGAAMPPGPPGKGG